MFQLQIALPIVVACKISLKQNNIDSLSLSAFYFPWLRTNSVSFS